MRSTVIYNAKIYINKGHFEEALIVTGDRIAAVGSSEKMLSQAPAGATRFNAAGRTIVPGFNDSHLHLQTLGQMLYDIQLLNTTSIKQVKEIARKWIAQHKPAPGTVLHGMGWNQDYFTDEKRLLTAQDLDEITTEYPLILERACAHILVCNSLALKMAGITPDTKPVEGGSIDVVDGKLTGIIRENECNRILKLRPAPTVDELKAQLRAAMAHAAESGVTSVQTMDMRPRNWRDVLKAYSEIQVDEPTLRIYHQHNFMAVEPYQEYLMEGYRTGQGTVWNRMGPLKLFSDGSLGARTAWMRQPYADDPTTRGIPTLTQEEANRLVALANANGETVATHAIGDAAIEMMLNAYDAACPDHTNPHRNGVIHVQITDHALLERFKKSNILAQVQPIFLHYDTRIVEDRVGKDLAGTSYGFETLRKLGVHTSFGTDCPIEDLNPFNNLYCAITRQNLFGNPKGGFHPEECFEVQDAVDAYTTESAYAEFMEKEKGRLLPGYLADLVVLSQDIFTCDPNAIKDTVTQATMVGGRFVYLRG